MVRINYQMSQIIKNQHMQFVHSPHIHTSKQRWRSNYTIITDRKPKFAIKSSTPDIVTDLSLCLTPVSSAHHCCFQLSDTFKKFVKTSIFTFTTAFELLSSAPKTAKSPKYMLKEKYGILKLINPNRTNPNDASCGLPERKSSKRRRKKKLNAKRRKENIRRGGDDGCGDVAIYVRFQGARKTMGSLPQPRTYPSPDF